MVTSHDSPEVEVKQPIPHAEGLYCPVLDMYIKEIRNEYGIWEKSENYRQYDEYSGMGFVNSLWYG